MNPLSVAIGQVIKIQVLPQQLTRGGKFYRSSGLLMAAVVIIGRKSVEV